MGKGRHVGDNCIGRSEDGVVGVDVVAGERMDVWGISVRGKGEGGHVGSNCSDEGEGGCGMACYGDGMGTKPYYDSVG